jgi:hypothetical protein
MYMYVRTCYYCSTSRLVDSLCDVLLSRHNEKSLPFIIAQKRKRNKRKNLWTTSIVVVEGRRRLKRTSVCSSFFSYLLDVQKFHTSIVTCYFFYIAKRERERLVEAGGVVEYSWICYASAENENAKSRRCKWVADLRYY